MQTIQARDRLHETTKIVIVRKKYSHHEELEGHEETIQYAAKISD